MMDPNENVQLALAALKTEYGERPSTGLHDALVAEFCREAVRRKRRRALLNTALGLAAALLLVVLMLRHPGREVGPPRVVPASAPLQSRITIPVVARVSMPVPRAFHRKPVAARTEYIALPYVEPVQPGERADVYRVKMPVAALTRYGLPAAYSSFDGTVTADLMVTQDGVAHAIHFVQ
jgi:hypothetical protein